MRLMRFAPYFAPHFVLVAAALAAGVANASPTDPRNGAEFTTLAQPQATQAVGKKVEVIEFFAYHCGACNAFEPTLVNWAKKQGDNIVMRRIPLPFQGPLDPEARLFLTLEAMGKLDEYHHRVFRAVHVERKRLMKDDDIISWAAANGLDKAKFMGAWNSFGVQTRLKRLSQIASAYKVSGTPTVVIDGKYVVSPDAVRQANKIQDVGQLMTATGQVLDALVSKAAASK
ncbi:MULTISPECIES: thiol:disulfide interchange protein DsbA/DsbL [Massilia]|uniref:Thiol:disulfide interchange protein n=1 Tax=Massilia aurea TaxID=373040 RepID=A0A422QRB4_9BURK|nr:MULTISPECIES: thiol:disulfide interchange protein DsbA/DsbL [Massilia]MDY0963667.1 thiol:disulfide interchange protein DsbA/DsbL [Massilia sp. CFBP9026]RNF32486.1 thiol:disulfide interchange protein DsbA [Massilia aurea]